MHSLTYQHNTGISQSILILANQQQANSRDIKHEDIRNAVRAWASSCRSREFVADLIVSEWRSGGGYGLDIPTDPYLQMQKVFRWLDGSTSYAIENTRQLTPAILAVLPVEFRGNLVPEDSLMARLSRLEKETSEAKVAVAMNAPRHQKLKELSEGIVEMFRVDPELTAPLMAMVTSMLGVM